MPTTNASTARADGGGAAASLSEPTRSETTLTSLDSDNPGWRDGLLNEVTRLVVEAVLEAELTEHLRDAHDPTKSRRTGGNCRNGTRRKTVWTIAGPVTIDAPRDRWGTFQPVTVGKWQRRVVGVDQLVLPLAAAGVSLSDTFALLSQGYGSSAERRVLLAMAASVRTRLDPWHERRIAEPCHALLLGRAVVRSRTSGHVAAPVLTAVSVAADGGRELVGLWLRPLDGGTAGWWAYLRALRGRGLTSPHTIVTHAMPRAVEEVAAVWPGTAVYLRAAEPGVGARRLSARRVR